MSTAFFAIVAWYTGFFNIALVCRYKTVWGLVRLCFMRFRALTIRTIQKVYLQSIAHKFR